MSMTQDFGYVAQAARKLAQRRETLTLDREGLRDALHRYADAWAEHHNASEGFVRHLNRHGLAVAHDPEVEAERTALIARLEAAERDHEAAKATLAEELWESI